MTKSKLFSGQTAAARKQANLNSHTSRQANIARAHAADDIDWDTCIANLKAYFKQRDKK